MKKIYLLLYLFFLNAAYSQVFNGNGGAILNNGGQVTAFNLNVSGLLPSVIDNTFGLEEIHVNVSHPAVEELHLYLKSPSGIEVDLSGVLSCKGAGFTETKFSNHNPVSVSIGAAPYTGTYKPIGNMGRFNTGKPGNGTWTLYIKDFVAGANAGTLLSWSLKFSTTPAKPVIFTSSNLPIVIINNNNKKLTDDESIVDLGIIDNGQFRNNITDPKNNYNGKAACHIRGSSSKMFEKNNLKIELRDALGGLEIEASLLGMPVESDWVLTAAYPDKTMLRNPLTQHLFRKMGHYAPQSRFVELVINEEYFGVYILTEQIKRGKDRVSISKMTSFDNQFPYITGGYIIQINRTDDPGWYSLFPGISGNDAKFYYQYNYPNKNKITIPQQNYIKSVLDSFETVMNSASFADPVNGYSRFIDENTFIDYLIINELSKNVDAYKLSAYLYKDNVMKGGKLKMGPTWDYDIAWHNCNFGNAFSELYWQYDQPNSVYPIPTWWKTLMKDPSFKDKLYCRYHTLRKQTLSNNEMYSYIDESVHLLKEAHERNFRQFPIIGAYIYPNPQQQQGATYEKEIQHLKDWIAKRAAWLDANVPGFCNTVALNEINGSGEDIKAFPNPFKGNISLVYNVASETRVSLRLYDMTGREIKNLDRSAVSPGEQRHSFSTEDLPKGPYFLKLSYDNRIYTRKVIKT
jgi:subtilisin-like proprotein convertase family protein